MDNSIILQKKTLGGRLLSIYLFSEGALNPLFAIHSSLSAAHVAKLLSRIKQCLQVKLFTS